MRNNNVGHEKKDWEMYTYSEEMRNWSQEFANNIALVDNEITFSYKEMYEKVMTLASYFIDRGLKFGDIVIMQFSNGYEFVLTLLSLFEIGVKPVLALPAHREKDIIRLVNKTSAVAYLADECYLDHDYVKLAEQLMVACPNLMCIVFSSEIRNAIEKSYEHIVSYEYRKPKPDDVALFLLSGGTTGTPKLIPRTHGDYIYNGKMCAHRCGLKSEDKYLVALPVAHNFALNNPGILATFDTGGQVVICRYPSPMEILELIEAKHITHTSLVPTLAVMCLQYLEWDASFNIKSLRFIAIGGAALTSSAAKQIKEGFKCQLMQVFGTAEGLICTTSLMDSDEVVFRTQGKPISEYDKLKIIDDNGNEVGIGEPGELITKGPYTIAGYYDAESVNKDSFSEDGFYKTGDMAIMTESNNIKIIGRFKEQINRAGEKIMPSEVEEYINNHPAVVNSVILGVPDELLGNSVCACVICRDPETITEKEVRPYLKQQGVSDYKIPDNVLVFETFPLTAVNKVDKQKLLAEVLNRLTVKEV